MICELIQPFTRPIRKILRLPGSKSIGNRALLLGALNAGALTLHNVPKGEDTLLMIKALTSLGFMFQRHCDNIKLFGQGGGIPQSIARINVGNAGTVARFLAAALCLNKGGKYTLEGTTEMHRRPMAGLLRALELLGATLSYQGEEGYLPFMLHTCGLNAQQHLKVNASQSSQILSALLMIAPFIPQGATLVLEGACVSKPFVAMTLTMMEQFGYTKAVVQDNSFYFPPSTDVPYCRTEDYTIEPDATAASYFLALAHLVEAQLHFEGLGLMSLQGDIAFAQLLDPQQEWIQWKGSQCKVANSARKKPSGIKANFNAISDTFLTAAACAPLFRGETHLWGIGHTRHQETDRIQAMATELTKLGQGIYATDDSLTIIPNLQALKERSREAPIIIETYKDHRMAMSFAILGSYNLHGDGRPWIKIKNSDCCKKTFPNFFKILKDLHNDTG